MIFLPASCILVDHDKIQVINRSASYKNQYVHRRTSISLQHLTDEQVEQVGNCSNLSPKISLRSEHPINVNLFI